ncbi:hypothetical protein WJX73_003271 [Symbiochloris irregularis]|uniref:Trimethylguanosine synthase n=1 Tax=Symbiochloris irregularis TaxID=706552 RepID=A0AAW1PAS0_9CHLO
MPSPVPASGALQAQQSQIQEGPREEKGGGGKGDNAATPPGGPGLQSSHTGDTREAGHAQAKHFNWGSMSEDSDDADSSNESCTSSSSSLDWDAQASAPSSQPTGLDWESVLSFEASQSSSQPSEAEAHPVPPNLGHSTAMGFASGIYGCKYKVQTVCADFCLVAPTLEADVVYMSPPWCAEGAQWDARAPYDVTKPFPVMLGSKRAGMLGLYRG